MSIDEKKELQKIHEGTSLIPQQDDGGAALGMMIREILSPVVEAMTQFMRQNTEAVERLAAGNKITNERMEALEKQIRLNTPVSPTQVRYFNDAIRKHARELLAKKELDEDTKAVKNLSTAIRKSIVSRYGIAALHEIPKHEYSVVMQQIDTWNDMLLLRDVMKEARNRHDAAFAELERATGLDGAYAIERTVD